MPPRSCSSQYSLHFLPLIKLIELWDQERKHVNYPGLRSTQARTQEEKMKLTRKKLHKTTDSQILWITYTLHRHNELFDFARRFSVDASAGPPPTGLFWAEFLILRCMKIWNGDLHEKKRSTALAVVGADGALVWGRARASFHHNCDFHIEWCIDWSSF